ncbi:MAG: DNA polymerase III subunit alpha [Bacteroidia bacterium]|nr:DNA polymerase III subunit alpha [Bacteroidia bacterium]
MYLNCHTYFSLRYGTFSVQQLVDLAKQYGIRSLALTDIHNTSACYDFVKACRKAEIDPVIGMEFRKDDQLLYIALARNLNGFGEINTFYSKYAHQKRPFPDLPPYWNDAFIIYPWERRDQVSLSEREFLGIKPHQVRQLLRSRYRHRQDRLVVHQPMTFDGALGQHVHRLLRAVDHNTLLDKLMQRQQAGEDERFIEPEQLRKVFESYPQIIANTERLLSDCSFNFVFGQNLTKQAYTGSKYDDMLLLEKLACEGMLVRYGNYHREAQRRIERELEIIDQLDFNAYFLITWDFVRYGKARGFFHVGRGSGANSIVAYCLGLTDVDPIELDLYFERFLNPKRTSPPDFDIDYSWKDRDDVLDYVLKRYRTTHATLLASYNTFKGRSSIRELGKVFGLPKREIDKLTQVPSWGSLAGKVQDETSQRILQYAQLIEGFPNHLSIHAGGVLISDAPIHSYTATDLPPKGFPISHFDMYVAEDIGLHKFDILSQRGLGHIRDGIDLVLDNKEKLIDIHKVRDFMRDPKVRDLLKSGRTVGCFYIESPAMRGLIRKLGCDNYLTLVAASSVIRPGVARSGMMRSFIERHNGLPFEYTHPKLEELLGETYGIMVYQEDVLKVVHGFAGLDLADADLLRRAMSGKTRGPNGFEVMKEKFLQACRDQEYPEEKIQEIWRQIESFAGYSFSKAHSASFAVESFQSLYLKAYYPLEFMVAVINNFGGFYATEFYLHEARRLGGKVHAPCVQESTYLTRLEGDDIYLGFIHVKDLEKDLAKRIEQERGLRGTFSDLTDFRYRMGPGEEQLAILVRIGAFRSTGKSKKSLLWEAKLKAVGLNGHGKAQQEMLFAPEQQEFEIPDLPQSQLEDAYDEMELLGYPLCSPFELVPNLPDTGTLTRNLAVHVNQVVCMAGYFVCAKTTKTVRGEPMQFANFLDREGETFDVTIFPQEVKQYPIVGPGIYMITGMVVEEFGYFSLELMYMKKWLFASDPRLVG